MLTAVVTGSGATLEVSFLGDSLVGQALVTAEEEKEVPENDLNPIAPELKEFAWGFGSFIVMFLVLRYALYPKLKKGMDARAAKIKQERDAAEALTASARADVAQYDAEVATLRQEAHQRVEAARATLEAERTERLAAANAEIAQRRAAALADVDAARAAAQGDVETAVVDVVGRAAQLATGRSVDPSVVSSTVRGVMGADQGVAR
ncbi:MAG: ATP synthase F0 subunit B [Ilumatobacteraceae bacterium]